jgi:hypothetical protein
LQVIGNQAPAFTVASFDTTTTSRPWIAPIPVTTPADGAPPHSAYMPCAAHSPSSWNAAPGSQSAATRSRAVILP